MNIYVVKVLDKDRVWERYHGIAVSLSRACEEAISLARSEGLERPEIESCELIARAQIGVRWWRARRPKARGKKKR